MWRKVLSLFIHKPELLLNHLEAYAAQAAQELHAARGRYLRSLAASPLREQLRADFELLKSAARKA